VEPIHSLAFRHFYCTKQGPYFESLISSDNAFELTKKITTEGIFRVADARKETDYRLRQGHALIPGTWLPKKSGPFVHSVSY